MELASTLPATAGALARARQRVEDNLAMGARLLEPGLLESVADVAARITCAYRTGNKVILFGNGGSAADAQHLAAEMCGRFLIERPALPAIALADNAATVTAIGNDYGYAEVFARQIHGFGVAGDVAIGISTSGRSENVVRGIEAGRDRGLTTVAMTGELGGRLLEVSEVCLCMPSTETPRIQEAHTLVGHIVCELVESALFGA